MAKDYYQILGVEKGSNKEEIKKAYKKLAMQYHPDRAPEEKKKEYEEKFKEINEAASVLGDDKKRQQYDQFGSSGSGHSGDQNGFQGFDFSDVMSHFRSGSFGNFEDVFDHLFGGGGGRRTQKRRGADLLYPTEVKLEEAASGTEKTLKLNKLEQCEKCQGRGALNFDNCHHCSGSGYIKRTQRTPFGLIQQSGPCPYCQGQGELPKDSCATCGGEGLVRRKKELTISVPAGVEQGMRLRIKGEGEVGENNGPSGDLFVEIRISPHEVFQREGKNIHLTVPISYTQAVLGDDIEIPTINSTAKLKIPAGTNSETVFRMKNLGLPSVQDSHKGDQLVKVKIEVPQKLSKKNIDLIKQLKEDKPSQSFLKKFFG